MSWIRTSPEGALVRVEHPQYGVVEDMPGALVKLVHGRCFHDGRAMSVVDGRKQLEERDGWCYRCLAERRKARLSGSGDA